MVSLLFMVAGGLPLFPARQQLQPLLHPQRSTRSASLRFPIQALAGREEGEGEKGLPKPVPCRALPQPSRRGGGGGGCLWGVKEPVHGALPPLAGSGRGAAGSEQHRHVFQSC